MPVQKSHGVRMVRVAFWDDSRGFEEVLGFRRLVRANHPAIKRYPENFYPEDYVDVEWP